MNVRPQKSFNRQFSRLKSNQKQTATNRIKLFVINPYDAQHPLKGEWHGYRSISVGGDLRIHFKELPDK
ncbi:hypothetical protein HYS01_02790 [Candidatus Saccharibacteria bacterium]|nr:hypothetical protein [Candidatus Saccharibacteria bacterium]